MVESKAWDWNTPPSEIWFTPSEESCAMAYRWKARGYKSVLDFGCGLGRHAMLFAKEGFCVSAFDLSEEAVSYVNHQANLQDLEITATVAEMRNLPYDDHSFDAIFAFHVITHTDTDGIKQTLAEVKRVLKPGGEIYFTLCSKEGALFHNPDCPRIDENTVVKVDDSPENGVPHFHAGLEDIWALLADFELVSVRHIENCYSEGEVQSSKNYFILAKA